MDILAVSFLALIVSFLLGKGVIPAVQKAKLKGAFPELTKVGAIAALGFVRKFTLILSITYAALWCVNGCYGLYLGMVVDDGDGGYALWHATSAVAERIDTVKSWQWFWTLIVLLVVFLVVIFRNGKRQALSAYETVKEQRANGSNPEMPPDEEMTQLREWMDTVVAERTRLYAIPDGSLDAEDRQRKEEAIARLDTMLEMGQALMAEQDLRRRIIPEMEARGSEKKTPRFAGLLTALGSRGMLNVLETTGSFLSKAGLVLLSLSFVMTDNGRIAGAVTEQARGISYLIIQREKQKVDEVWAMAMTAHAATGQEQSWTDEDEEVLDAISQEFERAQAGHQDFDPDGSADDPAAVFRLRASAVRGNILRDFAPESGTPRADSYTVTDQGEFKPKGGDAADDAARSFAEKQKASSTARKPASDAGVRFKEDLRAKAKANRGMWSDLRTKFSASSFRMPVQPKEVFNMIVNDAVSKATGEFFDAGFDGLGDPTFEREIAKKSASGFTNKFTQEYVKTKGDAFVNELLSTPDYDQGVRNFSTTTTASDKVVSSTIAKADLPTLAQVQERLQEFPATMDHHAISRAQAAESESALRKLAGSAGRETSTMADASMNYRYLFPGQPGMEATEATARLTGELGEASTHPGGGVGGFGGGGHSPSHRAATRARSYKMLRGFRRIGGVLIGIEPDNSGKAKIDLREISWSINDGQVVISLYDANGKAIPAGTYDADIVNQAIAYVADGRLVTVTMVSAKPVPFLKILVHPALVDTKLGCEAIGTDRLVDKHAAQRPDVADLLQRYQYQDFLYRYTVLKSVARLSDDAEVKASVDAMEDQIQENWSEIVRLLGDGSIFRDPQRSHIAARPSLYSTPVIGIVSDALDCDGMYGRFAMKLSMSRLEEEDIQNALNVATELWSGVREEKYTIDPRLDFLRAGSSSGVAPLQFIEQIAFIPSDEDEEAEIEPWEFPELKRDGRLTALVLQGVNTSANDTEALRRLRSFTLAQRLFRAALSGDLGYSFPVEKLRKLALDTHAFVKEVETPTWNGFLTTTQIQSEAELEQETKDAYIRLIDAEGLDQAKNKVPCN